jgi:hypothetical protein
MKVLLPNPKVYAKQEVAQNFEVLRLYDDGIHGSQIQFSNTPL